MTSLPLDRLRARAARLSNYARRFVDNIDESQADLVARLEHAGLRDEVHLRQPAWDLEREMDIVAHVAGDDDERIKFLGCYFGLQYLRMNIQALDALTGGVVPGESRTEVHRTFVATVGPSYAHLVVTFIRKVLDLLLAGTRVPPFVICGVGTLTDQDDVDIGVAVRGRDRGDLDAVLSRLNNVMHRYAARLHFHLSEHVSPDHFATTLDDYRSYVESRPGDYVVVSELLNAEPIYGDQSVFQILQEDVTARYYADGLAIHHEGFVRGALGEIRFLSGRPPEADRIVPKDDFLRVVRALVHIKRVLHNLRAPAFAANLRALADREPERSARYAALEGSWVFAEVLRYVYQLLVVQDEAILLDTAAGREALARVAAAMGYRRRGAAGPEESLLVHYYDRLERLRAAAAVFEEEIEGHLKRHSVFAHLVAKAASLPPNRTMRETLLLGRALARAAYWDDVLELLLADGQKYLRRLLDEYGRMEPKTRRLVGRELVTLFRRNEELFVKLLVILGENREHPEGRNLFAVMNEAFLKEFATRPNPAEDAARLFHSQPRLLHRYLLEVEHDDAGRFLELASGPVWDSAWERPAAALAELARLRYYGSAFLRRYFREVLTRHADALDHIDDHDWLAAKAEGMLAEAALADAPSRKKEALGDYYDLSLLRVGAQLLAGAGAEEVNARYSEFTDTYAKFLFDACREGLAEDGGRWVTSYDRMAIYAVGGQARGWAFSNDFDLMVFLDSGDARVAELGEAVIAAFNAEISRRGILPHHRLLDHFGRYVIPFEQMAAYLGAGGDADFIEKSQLLEARLLVGTSTLDEAFANHLVRPYILERPEPYLAAMAREINERHRAAASSPLAYDIGECPGGLRDIAMTILMCKARFGLRTPGYAETLEAVMRFHRDAGLLLASIYNSLLFLQRLRYAYRLTVCVDDNLQFEHADIVAEVLGFREGPRAERAGRVREDFEHTTAKVAGEIETLIDLLSIPRA